MPHILLIDDRRDDRLLAARELELAISDLRISEVASAAAFTQALAAGDFDLAVIDYQLRWSTGLTLLRSLKARLPNCPVIMFSATATAEEAVEAMKEGLDDYVSKSPRHYQRLALAVRAALDRAAARQRIAALEAAQAEMLGREQEAWQDAEAARVEAEISRARVQLLAEVSGLLSQSLDYEATLSQVAGLAVTRLADACLLFLEEGGQIQLVAAAHVDPELAVGLRAGTGRVRLDPHSPSSLVARAFRAGEPLLYSEVTATLLDAIPESEVQRAVIASLAPSSLIVAPLVGRGRTMGVLVFARTTFGRRYAQDDIDLVREIAQHAAVAVDNARLYSEARAQAARMATLAEASATFAANQLDPQALLNEVTRQVATAMGDVSAIALRSEDGQWLNPVSMYNTNPEALELMRMLMAEHPYRIGDGVAGRVAATGAPVLLPSIEPAAYRAMLRPEYWPYLERFAPRSGIVVPLRVRDQVIGTLTVIRNSLERPYTPDDQRLLQDLADRAALAIENARLYAEAQAAIRARDQFLAVASHELKTPLTALLGHTEIAARRLQRSPEAPPHIQRSVQIIAGQAQRLSRLITALLDLTRLQNDRLELSVAPVDLRSLTRQVVAELTLGQEEHRVTLALPPEPVIVMGDELRLEQVLINLVQNALKYSDSGARVWVAVERQDEAVVTVRDEGIGIPEAALPHLFSRFYRAPNVDAQHISGMGMGLFLVNEIVTRHRGRVEVASVEGQGSAFTVRLPLAGQE